MKPLRVSLQMITTTVKSLLGYTSLYNIIDKMRKRKKALYLL
jgi:hypothetical protein